MNKKHFIYSLPMILLLTVAVAGWFATDYLGKNAQQEIIRESQTSALTLSIYLSSTFTHIEGAVKSLAGSPWIAPALMSRRDQNIERANSALDRYNSAMNTSIFSGSGQGPTRSLFRTGSYLREEGVLRKLPGSE
jgi:C4-dicarboxylate-specific signal transduction histidine kinase